MKGDFTRSTFNKGKHYSGVRMQQGRVQLDADWNEQLDIERHRATTEATDVIGACGVPKDHPGFGVVVDPAALSPDEQKYLRDDLKLTPLAAGDFLLTPGRFYAGGTLCENEDFVAFTGQPDLRDAQPITDAGTYLVYLDVWQHHLTALNDEAIREQALGGPDSATRTRTVWQVKTRMFDDASKAHCVTDPKVWQNLLSSSTVKLQARAKPGEESKNLCALPPGAGYRRLENQLYRVEIHKPGAIGAATFKFSRENGSVVTAIKIISGKEIEVADLGRDQALGFANDDWVELLDDDTELKGVPGELAQIDHVDAVRRVITLKATPGSVNLKRHPKLRRWESRDGKAEFTVEFNPAVNGGWIALEDGVEIQFSPGSSNTGDFWLVPARTASNDVEWPVQRDADGSIVKGADGLPISVAQPPLGIAHDYCCLAIVERVKAPDKLELTKDCREIFPPLTHVCAEDVCFDNEHCKFPGAETVQDAIEALCREDLDTDLKTHNKYLHGSGVVCGLKLRCDSDRRQVSVEQGYALECEGNSIRVPTARTYPIVEAAEAAELLDKNGNGEVCVRIERGEEQDVRFSVEAVVPQAFWDSVLEGTLPKDFYKDCIESMLNFFKSSFLPIPDDTVPVSDKQKRVISVLNLLIQLLNSASGPYVFLSTEEHEILLKFYNDLKALIASETFCAMFDGDRKFPDYPYKTPPGIETAFGLFKFHRHLRLHPSGNYAYTCGGGPTIQAYDLQTRTLKELLTFPGGSNVEVQDVAFSPDGSEMYVVALNNQDSVFVTVTIGPDQSHSWGPTAVLCDFKFVSLATSASRPGQLLAVAKVHGLYSFNPANIPLTPGAADVPFNATGLLKVSDDGKWGFAAATKPAVAVESLSYDLVQRIDLAKLIISGGPYSVHGLDTENDIAHQAGANDGTIHITGDPGAGLVKPLHSFIANSGMEVAPPIDLQDNTATRLAILPEKNQLLVSLSDRYKLVRVNLDPANRKVDSTFRVPVQIMPLGLSLRNKNEVVVLNYLSNALSVVDIANVIFSPAVFTVEPPTTLSAYRQQILNAYGDLLGHLLQHLKDCFCDHYLVDCPDCERDTKVYLGCVEIKDREVFNICNLSKRHYVKTFKTYGYWLSTIPVLPLIKQAIARFCCRVL